MGRLAAKNSLLNILGAILPPVAGIIAAPVLLKHLGTSAVGVFSLALGLIGILSFLDLGIGRGITRLVASFPENSRETNGMISAVNSGLIIMALIGATVALALFAFTPKLVVTLQVADSVLREQAVTGFRYVALSFPFGLLASGLLAVLEGRRCFSRTNMVKVPVGVLTYTGPAIASLFTADLSLCLLSLAVARATVLPLSVLASRGFWTFVRPKFHTVELHRLLRFSGWLTVSNVVGPVIAFVDRFYLAAIFPFSIVAYYTVPFDGIFRLMALPSAAVNGVFPELARANAKARLSSTISSSTRGALLDFWLPPLAVASLLAEPILRMWLGEDFATHSSRIMSVLAVGIFVNGFSQFPMAILHAHGRSDLTAKLHVLELPIYLILLISCVTLAGLWGAAIAWALRACIDFSFLFVAVAKVERLSVLQFLMSIGPCLFAAMAVTVVALVAPIEIRIVVAVAIAIFAAIQAWRSVSMLKALFESSR